MATKKAGRKAAAPAGNDAPLGPAELNSITRLVTHTARMNIAVEQSPSGQTHEDRGYHTIIAGYKGRWAGLSKSQRKAAIDAASEVHDMTPQTIKAAVAALEG